MVVRDYRPLVGVDGAHAAWLLAQHVTLASQMDWVVLLRWAAERGQAALRDWAYLEDPRAHAPERVQRFATQGSLQDDVVLAW